QRNGCPSRSVEGRSCDILPFPLHSGEVFGNCLAAFMLKVRVMLTQREVGPATFCELRYAVFLTDLAPANAAPVDGIALKVCDLPAVIAAWGAAHATLFSLRRLFAKLIAALRRCNASGSCSSLRNAASDAGPGFAYRASGHLPSAILRSFGTTRPRSAYAFRLLRPNIAPASWIS